MNRGRIVQEGNPRELYERPACRFAAEFIGNANLLAGTVTGEHSGGYHTIRLAEGLELRGCSSRPHRGTEPDAEILLCIRPENVELVPAGTQGENVFAARVTRVSYLGASLGCELALGAAALRADVPARSGLVEGAEISVRIDPDCAALVPNDE
jgi:iron(III) transport system ATP-binding protein